MSKRSVKRIRLSLLVAFFVVGSMPRAYADPADPQSTSYKFEESVLGVGGMNQSSSSSYRAEGGTGDIGIGNSSSNGFQINAGSKTSPDPTLSVAINGTANLGDFSSTAATMTTSTFTVSNYTSYGYVVNIIGTPPTNSGHTITPMTALISDPASSSTVGFEQFGINLVANTSPQSTGANPDQGQFGFGIAAPNYDVSNKYHYVSGDAIALSNKTSGVTTFTISYLVNVGALTPGGQYTSDQTLIITGTY